MQIVLSRVYDVDVSSMIFFTFYIFDTYFDQSLVLFENVEFLEDQRRNQSFLLYLAFHVQIREVLNPMGEITAVYFGFSLTRLTCTSFRYLFVRVANVLETK